jgi:class 3 adenylate cyclase
MTRFPSGTVTVLMSDVVSSSARWRTSHARTERELDRLHECVHAGVAANGGTLVKARGEGDSHFAAFDRPSDAMRAGAAIQRCLGDDADGVRVRIAIAVGEIDPRDGDYVGLLINQTARIRGTAHGGQVICTRPVVDVALPLDDLDVLSLGAHRVRDIAEPIELFQLCGEGLHTSFPPLQTLDTAITAVMTIVSVDEVGSSIRRATPDALPGWQGPLYRAMRAAAAEHDGRHLKLTGDGCLAAFEDPRNAVAFAQGLCARAEFDLRAGIAAGLVELVEGELTGLPFFHASTAMRSASAGQVILSPVVAALVGDAVYP